MKRIMATFVPQVWVKDNAVNLEGEEVDFDVTDTVAAMNEEERNALQDDQYNTDALLPDNLKDSHNGPFYVRVETAIQEYYE